MDARQQPALAPLELRDAGRELTAQHESLVLERAKREVHVGRRHAERRGYPLGRGRTDHLEPATHQLSQGVLAGPRLGAVALGGDHGRLAADAREDGFDERNALGGDPEARLMQEGRRAPGARQLLEQPFRFRTPHSAFRTRQGTGDQ